MPSCSGDSTSDQKRQRGDCGVVECGGVDTPCGKFANSCGEEVDCGTCRWTRQALYLSTLFDLAIGADGTLHLAARAPEGDLVYGSGTTLPVTTETVSSAVGNSSEVVPPVVLIDSQGEPHIIYVEEQDYVVRHAYRSGPSWQIEDLGNGAQSLGAAIDASDRLHVAWYWAQDIVYRAGSAGAWAPALPLVENANAPNRGAVDVAMGADGKPNAFFVNPATGTLEHAAIDGATYTLTTIDSAQIIGQLAMVRAARSGEAWWVSYFSGYETTNLAIRYGGAWITEVLSNDDAGEPHDVVVGPGGVAHVAYIRNRQLGLARRAPGVADEQILASWCAGGGVAIAADPSGRVHVIYSCSATGYLTVAGSYPAGYEQACHDAAANLCAAACGCNPGTATNEECCLERGGSTYCTQAWGCAESFGGVLCGDPTRDPAWLSSCESDAPSAECDSAAAPPSLLVPTSCAWD